MLGIAMLTIVRSSSVMKNPSDTTTRTAHGFPRSLAIHPTLAHPAEVTRYISNPNEAGVPPRRPDLPRTAGRAAGMLPGMELNGTSAVVSGGASGLGEA